MFIFNRKVICLLIILIFKPCEMQPGPDGWDENIESSFAIDNEDIPPDLKLTCNKKSKEFPHMEQWFFKRLLNIILKSGQLKKHEDSIDINIQMKFNLKEWELLNEYVTPESTLTDDMFRRSLGHIEEAIYKPSFIETNILAWSDYIQSCLVEYKMYITWGMAIIGSLLALVWFYKNVASNHKVITGFCLLYIYEAFISYKEAEKKELDIFISEMNKCKWIFWSSSCDVPSPDPLIFLKYMNPLKIMIRMFSNFISEPIIALSTALKTMVEGIAEGFWYPFDKIMYGVLIVFFNLFLLIIILMIFFNFLLNIPFNFNVWGLFSLGIPHRTRTNSITTETLRSTNASAIQGNQQDTISQPTLIRILDILSRAIPNHNSASPEIRPSRPRLAYVERSTSSCQPIRRSASAGRLNNFVHSLADQKDSFEVFRRHNKNGSGDA